MGILQESKTITSMSIDLFTNIRITAALIN